MLDDTTSFNPDTAQAPGDLTPDVTTSGLTSLNLSELRATISNAHSALETELADTAAVSLSESDSALLRIGQPDVNYAFTDTLERGFETLVLSNAMKPMRRHEAALLDLRERFGDKLTRDPAVTDA